jgi:PadR family transcriptional regulator PadR
MEDLTKIEETVLIAIWQLGDQAYGYKIRKHIQSVFEKEFTIGNLYSVLNQLDRKAYVLKSIEESGERRRGKPKVFYTVTDEGMLALNASRKAHNLIWKKIPQQAFEITEP